MRNAIFSMLFALFVMFTPVQASAQTQQPPSGGGGFFQDLKNAVVEATNSKAEQNGKSYQEWKDYYQNDTRVCWGCRLFSAMGTATEEMGREGVKTFAGPARSAVAAFMGLWVMWQLYLMLSISHANSPAQSIDTIFNRLVVMMVVLWLLGNNNIFSWILNPFLDTLASVMQAAAQLMGGGSSSCGSVNVGPDYVQKGNVLLCGMQRELNGGLALGGWMVDSANLNPFYGSLDILQLLAGIIIFAVFAFMLIILPFRFFDALVRIATVAAVLPIVVLAFLFKPTRGAVKQAATSLLAAMLTFLFTAIAIALAVNVLNQVTPTIFNQQYSDTVDGWFGPVSAEDFMMLLTAALGMASMISHAGTLASEFAGFQGQMGNAGSQGANMITGAANLAGKTAGGAAGAAFTGNRVAASVGKVIKPGSAG